MAHLLLSLLFSLLPFTGASVHPDGTGRVTFQAPTPNLQGISSGTQAASRHIDVMMEKPLAVSMDHAHRIERAAKAGGVDILVNYETTWYPSHAAMWRLLKEQRAGGEIRKMVALDGHQGPREINVGSEF